MDSGAHYCQSTRTSQVWVIREVWLGDVQNSCWNVRLVWKAQKLGRKNLTVKLVCCTELVIYKDDVLEPAKHCQRWRDWMFHGNCSIKFHEAGFFRCCWVSLCLLEVEVQLWKLPWIPKHLLYRIGGRPEIDMRQSTWPTMNWVDMSSHCIHNHKLGCQNIQLK